MNDFKILFDFLIGAGAEVEGRASDALEPDERERLQRFFDGACSEEEKAEVTQMLRNKPPMMSWLAQQVKIKRSVVARKRSGGEQSAS